MKGQVLRKIALLSLTCASLLFSLSRLALAQHGDIMVNGGELESLTALTDVATFQPPQEKIGLYVGVEGEYVPARHRFGLNLESSWRYHRGDYYGYETYRPFFTDANALYQSKITKKVGLDLIGGIGVASNRFYLLGPCGIPGCVNYTSSNHFMEDLAFGIRYPFLHHLFVRPEVHYYHIHSNQGFNSDNVFRGAVSIGYRWGK
jgi:hypothetical protein